MISTQSANEYKSKHGHYPLLIGREYEYFDDWVRLVQAEQYSVNVLVESRFDMRLEVDRRELGWKPDKHPSIDLATLSRLCGNWHEAKFGRRNVLVPPTLRKLHEEVGELVEACMEGDVAHILEESADVFQILCNLTRTISGDEFAWPKAVAAKHEEIWRRLAETRKPDREDDSITVEASP